VTRIAHSCVMIQWGDEALLAPAAVLVEEGVGWRVEETRVRIPSGTLRNLRL